MATDAVPRLRVRLLVFARLREALGYGERDLEVPAGATLDDVWSAATAGWSEAAAMRASTRFARNGVLSDGGAAVADGDEIALLPPVGGG